MALPSNSVERSQFRARLLRWYDAQRRPLPWRAGRDPYRVWISEIMLQQTRVAAVLEHYARFLRRFPNVQPLARARTASVLAAWSGLGYYRRARMLHQAARQIVRERGGRFPESAEEWRKLAGIGRYTAAAIASIAFDESCAVVDGNVERVLERMGGVRPRECWAVAEQLLSRRRPGDFNQAMMELGATVCVPGVPKCAVCPVRRWCNTSFPLSRSPSAAERPARRVVEQVVALVIADGKVLLVQRGKRESVMPAMWELPSVSSECSISSVVRFSRVSPQRTQRTEEKLLFTVRHAIMDTDYVVGVAEVGAGEASAYVAGGARWFSMERAAQLPLTGLTRKILRRAGCPRPPQFGRP